MKILTQAILVVAVLASVAGGVFLLVRQSSSDGKSFQIALPTAAPVVELKVYVSGAVRSPGVYTVREGDRLADVIAASGGATDDADLTAVNLALRVKDEEHWHVPTQGEAPPPATAQEAQKSSASGKININTATLEELMTLPNIADARAKAIISYRETRGPFASVDDLLDVPGIGDGILASIRDLVEVR